jgi:hypothetical protein
MADRTARAVQLSAVTTTTIQRGIAAPRTLVFQMRLDPHPTLTESRP